MTRYVERSVVIVRPRQPYADWANGIDDDAPRFDLSTHRNEPTAYLVDNPDDLDDLDAVLRKCWRDIFEEELDGWMRDPECWPGNRSFSIFKQWFDCELIVSVTDQGSEPIYGD